MRNAGARVNHGGEILQGQTYILKHSREFTFLPRTGVNCSKFQTEKCYKLHFLSVLWSCSDRTYTHAARYSFSNEVSHLLRILRDFYEVTVGRDIFIGLAGLKSVWTRAFSRNYRDDLVDNKCFSP